MADQTKSNLNPPLPFKAVDVDKEDDGAPAAPLDDEAKLAALEGHDSNVTDNAAANMDFYEDDSDNDSSKKTTYILEQQLENLRNLGFSENAIKKAYASGCINEKSATQWITMQLDHPELNTPLDPAFGRVVIKKKVILTPEQRVAKIAELKSKIAKKKEEQKQQTILNERAAEKSRIEGGKIAMEVREELQARARAQAYAEQRRQKDEEVIAKEKIQLQLAIDKLVRKGKSVEEAEEIAKSEFAEARRKMEEKTAALQAERRQQRAEAAEAMLTGAKTNNDNDSASPKTGGSTWNLSAFLGEEQVAHSQASQAAVATAKPKGSIDESELECALPRPDVAGFASIVEKMKQSNPTGSGETIAMLTTIVMNILQSPMDQKKRYLRASNSQFKTKIIGTTYALTFLRLLGFQVGWVEIEGGKKEQTVVMTTVIIRRLCAALTALETS
eukprot:GILI01024847.1.p1 GENE.GILI01024847.1~~GILI01024847.1.p1  ORF type:complete len:468 (+),score=109.96 GILI01024847.1:70-1404(+)